MFLILFDVVDSKTIIIKTFSLNDFPVLKTIMLGFTFCVEDGVIYKSSISKQIVFIESLKINTTFVLSIRSGITVLLTN